MTTTRQTRPDRHGSATVTLPSDREILITRAFDAPAALVFKAYTTPELVRRWWGFDTHEWRVCEIDLRVGGAWRYVTWEPEAQFEVGFHGEYRAVDAPNRLVMTEVFEGLPPEVAANPDDAAAVTTIVFEERDGVTTMLMTVLHQSQEHRDMHIASGMEGGMQVSMDRMEAIIAELDAA